MKDQYLRDVSLGATDPSLPATQGRRRLRIVLIDDDNLFRETLSRNLADEQIDVVDFGDGAEAVKYMQDATPCDAVLLDWKMPGLSGLEVLRWLKSHWPDLPVLIVTAFSNEPNEIAALNYGAVDFLEKSRSPQIIATRVRLIVDGRRGLPVRPNRPERLRIGRLELRLKVERCHWQGERVPLTVTEYAIVHLLASRAGEEVSYRDIYDVVHGSDFVAGDGADGYRANVRSLIKRIRHKFRDLDADFAQIENYPGFGYCWRMAEAGPSAETRPQAVTADPAPASGLIAQFRAALGKLPFALGKETANARLVDSVATAALLPRDPQAAPATMRALLPGETPRDPGGSGDPLPGDLSNGLALGRAGGGGA